MLLLPCGVDLWMLGYPDQALRSIRGAHTPASWLTPQPGYGSALDGNAPAICQEKHAAREGRSVRGACWRAGICPRVGAGEMILQGWAFVERGRGTEEIVQIQQGLAAFRATGSVPDSRIILPCSPRAYGKVGQVEEGLKVLDEALAGVHQTGEEVCKAELYRLKGELLQSRVTSREAGVSTCIRKKQRSASAALAVAQRQQARSWELRAAMSLSRLWPGQATGSL